MSKGKCIILCAPSGSGKTTLVKHLLDQHDLNLIFSISATTRKIREGEKNGKDYYYFTNKEFLEKIDNENFLEYEEVYNGIFYGTFKDSVKDLLEDHNVIFDTDVEGGIKLKTVFKEDALAIFVKPPSINELRNRLHFRNKETRKSINIRLSKAKVELLKEKDFDEIILNDDLKSAKIKAYNLVKEFLDN